MTKNDTNLLRLLNPLTPDNAFSFDADELSGLRAAALRHNLFMLVYARVKKGQAGAADNRPAAQFLKDNEALYLSGVARSMRQERVADSAISLLKERGIPALVFKGSVLARDIYEYEHCRASSDIDILIRQCDIFNTDAALTFAGYIKDEGERLEFSEMRLHHTLYQDGATLLAVEVHWDFGIPGFFNLSSVDIWDEVVYTNGTPAGLSPYMTLMMLFMHHYMHFFRDLWILVDILHAVARFESSIEVTELARRLREAGLVRASQTALRQIADLWGEQAAGIHLIASLRAELDNTGPGLPQALYRHFRMDMSKACFSHSRMDRFAARFALDRPSVIAKSFFKTVLPSPEVVKKYYGDPGWYALPYNYIRFISGRVKTWLS
jgi:hypothetical protein